MDINFGENTSMLKIIIEIKNFFLIILTIMPIGSLNNRNI